MEIKAKKVTQSALDKRLYQIHEIWLTADGESRAMVECLLTGQKYIVKNLKRTKTEELAWEWTGEKAE